MNSGRYYIETYGCQMNAADSELVAGLLEEAHYCATSTPAEADIILVNTCSVRENAERRAMTRLSQFKSLKKQNPDLLLGIIGCVAQRDKGQIRAQKAFIDLVLGPDAYRQLPSVLAEQKRPLVNTRLSRDEVYADLLPFRNSQVNAWISIMRGCDKFCSFCIVPYTRGRERSRPIDSILQEIETAVDEGYPEFTLLGQNVNSYHYQQYRFPDLLETVAQVNGIQRIRFTSPHPEDVDTRMLAVMQKYVNICPHIHLPLQAGSDRVLRNMNRSYTRERYLKLVEDIRSYLPAGAISTDIIVGFPDETEADFRQTLAVMDAVIFDNAFMFQYSPRPGTRAAEMDDDVPGEVKAARLERIIRKQKQHTLQRNRALIGTVQEVLIDGTSKKDESEKVGRTVTNKLVVLKIGDAPIGELVSVKILDAKGVSLFGKII